MLQQLDWPGVLNLLAQGSDLPDADVRKMLDAGWELASHTSTTLDLTTLDSTHAGAARWPARARSCGSASGFRWTTSAIRRAATTTTVISAVHRRPATWAPQTEIPGLADAAHPVHPRPDRDPAVDGLPGFVSKLPVRSGAPAECAGASKTGCGGSRPSCPAPGRRSAPASAASARRPFESLNLGRLTGDRADAVRENRHRLAAALGIDPRARPDRPAGARAPRWPGTTGRPQPSGVRESGPGPAGGRRPCHRAAGPGAARVRRRLPAGGAGGAGRRGDDPLRLARAGGGDRASAGWRRSGREAAAVGPGIGPCCYEVGDEVLSAFAPLGPGVADGPDARPARGGAAPARAGGRRVGSRSRSSCTSCHPELFFSHRRDGGRHGPPGGSRLDHREAGCPG